MRRWCLVLLILAWGCGRAAAELNMDWAYHDDADDIDDRSGEKVPAEPFAFLGNGMTVVDNDEPVTIYVLTANQFAGDQDEQVFVRWWNGEQEHWVMGTWQSNVYLGENQEAGTFHGEPASGDMMLDLWKMDIGPELTKPGENYYVIQMKGWSEDGPTERYLVRDSGGEDSAANNLGQAWTAGDYFGHDWSVTIKE